MTTLAVRRVGVLPLEDAAGGEGQVAGYERGRRREGIGAEPGRRWRWSRDCGSARAVERGAAIDL